MNSEKNKSRTCELCTFSGSVITTDSKGNLVKNTWCYRNDMAVYKETPPCESYEGD